MNPHILVGMSGGIACYKTVSVVRLLKKKNAKVNVIMTKNAKKFITPLTMQSISNNIVRFNTFTKHHNKNDYMEHIKLAKWAQHILLAPATANIIAKLTYGFADNLLTTICLATKAPISIVPSMNQIMWLNISTQTNIKILKNRGIDIIGPELGEQACGDFGYGCMTNPKDIVRIVMRKFLL